MTQIIKIAKWEYLNRVKTKLFIITTLLLPVLFALISILPTWLATLDPEKRNLLQVKYSSDKKKDQKIIHTLMGNDVSIRKDFIISNALEISNLDI